MGVFFVFLGSVFGLVVVVVGAALVLLVFGYSCAVCFCIDWVSLDVSGVVCGVFFLLYVHISLFSFSVQIIVVVVVVMRCWCGTWSGFKVIIVVNLFVLSSVSSVKWFNVCISSSALWG